MIDVTMLGARGDGRTDDSAAIQKALDQAMRSGDTVYFPSGVYMIRPGKALRVCGRTTVQGDGPTSVLRASGGGFGWELMRAAGDQMEIRDIVLDGNNRVNRVLVIGGGSHEVTVENVQVTRATHSTDPGSEFYTGIVAGIVIYGNSEAIRISGCEISHVQAVNLTSGSLIARGIYVTTAWGSAERVARDVTINNSHIHHIGPADDGDGIYYEDPALDGGQGSEVDSVISGNQFDHCAKRAIKIYADGITTRDNRITNSYLNNNYYMGTSKGKLAPDMYSAISLYGNHQLVERNTINGSGSFYAAIEVASGQEVHDITIQNNQISMGERSSISGTTGIRLGNIRDFKILNNTVNNGERGIWTWQNASGGEIRGNILVQKRGGGIDLSTYLRGYVQRNIICANNRIRAAKFTVLTSPTNQNVVVRQ